MSMFTIAKEIFPPTGIEHVVRCNFVGPNILNVIVAKSSVLEVFNFVEPAAVGELPRLELVMHYRFNGIITSMGVIRTTSSGQHGLDSILLSFKDAKMSLLEWSFSTHSIVTVSIHYFERDDYKQEFLNNTHPTEIRVDPSRRCAILSFYGDRLAVLPFRQDEGGAADDEDATKKWPYLPSFVMSLSEIDVKIKNVIDMVFLYDFFEPTLAILFSPQQTWTGRLAARKDTCSVVVVSLNITQKTYPVIFAMDNLPYDCTKIIAVPKPVSGLLIISANALIHLDQGSTGLGVGVNAYAPMVTNYPLDAQLSLDLALEGAHHVFLAPDEILLLLRDGDMYVVTLQLDGRSLSKFKIEKAGTSLQASCTCLLGTGYFFLGSRYGDSMLVRYSTKDEGRKKKKVVIPMNAMDLDSELYGSETITMESVVPEKQADVVKEEIASAMGSGESKWQFEICDTITNTGPIVCVDVGQRASDEGHEEFPPQHELVAATGSGKNGALVIFQRNIRPDVVQSTNALAGAVNLWTLFCRKRIIFEGVSQYESRKTTSADVGDEQVYDKLLVISEENRTIILATGDELRQLPLTEFYTEGPTVTVGSILEDTRIVQVYASGVRVLNADSKMTQLVPIGENLTIVAAHIADPYVLLHYHDGSATLLKGDMATKDINFLPPPAFLDDIPITSCCLYSDATTTLLTVKEAPSMSLLKKSLVSRFSSSTNSKSTIGKRKRPSSKPKKESTRITDDIDLDLYGPDPNEEVGEDETEESDEDDIAMAEEVDATMADGTTVDPLANDGLLKEAKAAALNPDGSTTQATHWCVIYRSDGTLEIYQLPDFKEVFFSPHFDFLPDVLIDTPGHQDTKPSGYARELTEMRIANLGSSLKREPYLVVRNYRGQITLYKTFQHFPAKEADVNGKSIDLSDRLAIRFRKVPHDNVARETPDDHDDLREDELVDEFEIDDQDDYMGSGSSAAAVNYQQLKERRREERRRRTKKLRLVPFVDVAGYEGIFCLGATPLWIMSSGRGLARIHPMICDGKIDCFTQFHNINCKSGFITTNSRGNMKISQLPFKDIQYDMPWPIRKVELNRTVRQLKYHPTSQTYIVITATVDPYSIKDDAAAPSTATASATPAGSATPGLGGREPSVTPAQSVTSGSETNSGSGATNGSSTTNGLNGSADSSSSTSGGAAKPKATRVGGGFLPNSERQTVELVSPVTWETVDRYELQEYEIVTSMETVSLESTQDASGRKKFLAVGTAFIKGEDSTMRGTIYIFDIIDVVPEPDNPQTDHKLKLLCTEEVKGAVTAMGAIGGYLLTCVGTKVVVRSFEDNEVLTGIAFIDVQIFVTSVKVVKNTIILADAYKSVWFIGFQDEPTKLVLLSKDYSPMESANVSYLIENQTLYIVVADSEKNLRLLQYAPMHVQSFSGQKLICRGDFHVGSQIQSTISLPKIVLSGSNEGISHLSVAGTLDGSLVMVTPIPEKTSKRLQLLSMQLVNGVQHPAGLNPRSFRLLQSKDRLSFNPVKGVLDGDLLQEFATLAVNRQKEMTKQIGTSVDRVLDDLAAIAVAADHF